MQLRRIEVREFRKIGHRVIDGLDDGLNVLVGDNEAGKSTLLAALRAVFFERHSLSGKPIEAMLPYGGNVRPEIAVDFDVRGAAWHLRKAFNQRPEAELTGPGERLTGSAVEDRLAELLGFTPPGRGASKPDEHHGTHGLLWVEQGTRESLGVGAGRDTLASALEREVGQVTGGERGRLLLAAAAARRDQFWTRTEKPRGEYKELRDKIEEFEREQADLLLRQHTTEARIARLSDVGDMLARHTRDDRLDVAAAAARAARGALAAAEALDGALQHATARRREAERDRVAAEDRRARRAALVAEAGTARGAAETAVTEAGETDALVALRETQARDAEARLTEARRDWAAAEAVIRALDEALRRRQNEAELSRHVAHFALAAAQDEARRAALARAEAQPLDTAALAALVRLEKTAETARAELRAAGLQLTFEPENAREISVDGVPHSAAQPLRLARDTVLELEGFGRVTIRPGGGTAALSRKADAAEEALREALDRARVSSVADARLAIEAKTVALAEAGSLGKSLEGLAPKGIDALRKALDTEKARLAHPLGDAAAALADRAEPALLADAQQAERSLRQRVDAAQQDEKVAATARQEALLEAARLSERRTAAQHRRDALAANLVAARSEADDDLLVARLQAADAALGAAQTAERLSQEALEAADPETARLSLERAERAEREIRLDIETLDRERRDIMAELRGSGQDGLGERLGEIEGQLLRERKRLGAMEVEASAARLLFDALQEAQREAKDRWVAPVRARAAPYLKLMAPGSDIDVDEHTLELKSFSRNGVTEPFSALSMGAREQVAVITRLALADVLRDAGHAAAVILDDALVNTDERRLDRMHNVLTRAARGLQILVLTCRERDFVGLGKVHRI